MMIDQGANAKSLKAVRRRIAGLSSLVISLARVVIIAFGVHGTSSLVVPQTVPRAMAQTQTQSALEPSTTTLSAQIPSSQQVIGSQAKRMSLTRK